MDRTTRIKLRKLLVELYGNERAIRQVVIDADLNVGRINLSGAPDNIWHDVLTEAEKVDKVVQLVETVCVEFPEKRLQLNELLGDEGSVHTSGGN
ncbi:MAG: effector-associated domain EAD1-containing protein [Caldilineaceae bacterium]